MMTMIDGEDCGQLIKDVCSEENIVSRVYSNDPEFKTLDLEKCTVNALNRFSDALANNTVLKELKCCEKNLGNTDLSPLIMALQRNASIECLELSGDCMEMSRSIDFCRAVSHRTKSLCRLSLEFNQISHVGTLAVADAIRHNANMEEVVVHGNGVGDRGMVELSSALRNSTMAKLVLRKNGITAVGAKHLAESLSCCLLEDLDLSFNAIGDEGAGALASSLANNHSLKRLHLEWNRIGPVGAASLANGLRHNSTLISLDISFGNQIEESGVAALADAIRHNKTLLKLTLWDRFGWNRYGQHMEDIQFYLSINKAGRKYVGDVSIPFSAWPMILARQSSDPSILYYFLQSRPDLLLKT